MKRRTEAQWQKLFEEHKDSGLTAVAFCKERGLCSSYFSVRRRQWLKKAPQDLMSSFIPVEVGDSDEMDMLKVYLSKTLRVHIPSSISPRWLAEFVQHLRS